MSEFWVQETKFFKDLQGILMCRQAKNRDLDRDVRINYFILIFQLIISQIN